MDNFKLTFYTSMVISILLLIWITFNPPNHPIEIKSLVLGISWGIFIGGSMITINNKKTN